MTFVIVKIVTFYSGDLIRPVPMMVLSNTNNLGKNTMQLKLMPLLASAIALALTTTPLAVKAQPALSQLPTQTQETPGRQRLQLTQEQKAKMAEIRNNTRSQIEAILTPQQREQLKAAMQEPGQKQRQSFAALNLTPEQKTQMRQIRQSAKSQFEAVLTPEQRQQMQQNRQFRHQQRDR
jgi:Spy/CpxP family protein refolding chaperone